MVDAKDDARRVRRAEGDEEAVPSGATVNDAKVKLRRAPAGVSSDASSKSPGSRAMDLWKCAAALSRFCSLTASIERRTAPTMSRQRPSVVHAWALTERA